MTNTRCISCPRLRYCRGLCRTCYQREWQRVRCGEVTWAELERQGRAAPPRSTTERGMWLSRDAFRRVGR